MTTLGSRIRCPIYAYDSSRPCVISSKACQKMATAKKDSYVKTDVLCKSEVSFSGSTILLIAARRIKTRERVIKVKLVRKGIPGVT